MAKKGAKKKVSDLQVARSMIKHEGKVSAVAKELGVRTGTIYARMKTNPRIRARFEDAEEALLDQALGVLSEKLEDGDFKAAQYVLDNRGKKRGYGSKQIEDEDDKSNGATINILETEGMDVATKKLLMDSLIAQQNKLEDNSSE